MRRRGVPALDVGVPVGKQTARTRLPRPDVKVPDAQALGLLERLPHDARWLGGRPRGDWYEEFDAIQFERAVRLLLVDQHLRLVEVQHRVEQRFVLEVVAHRAGRLMFDAVGYAIVAGRFGSLGRLEPGRRVTNCRDAAIDGVAQAA